MYEYTCKYCGKKTQTGNICSVCCNKLPYVQKLVKMLEPYRKEVKNDESKA